jgi:hypothetical protein
MTYDQKQQMGQQWQSFAKYQTARKVMAMLQTNRRNSRE